jgi:putative phage-type endonuclease
MKILDLEQGSEAWLAVRRQYVTASEMASVLKIPGAFKSRQMLMKHKLEGEPPLAEYQVNLFAQGHEAEAELTAWVSEELGMSFVPQVILDEKLGILASLDNINTEHGVIVETKISWAAKKLELAREFKVWEPYRVQVLTQMLVANVKIGFMCMRDKNTEETFLIPVSPDPVMYERIKVEAAKFLDDMKKTQYTVDTVQIHSV